MKRSDILILLALVVLFLPFILFERIYNFYDQFYVNYPFLTSFVKFAILATAGELIGLRIRTGTYFRKGFGILPRAIVWGFLGVTIQAAFIIFTRGVPMLLEFMGFTGSTSAMSGKFSLNRLGVAFSISLFLNLFYAPVLMTVHKITDSHIEITGGTIRGFLSRMDVAVILAEINWDSHWGFVLRKTIVFFWIPAQTINFLLPEQFRVLIAAIYGIILGVILAFAARTKAV
ncbi:MAG TPA: Mpv17/PMP22 family protein [Bacteroidales bacterium]|nr:Mpv17/PMP22 family protein [Bacteroidales bacterium]